MRTELPYRTLAAHLKELFSYTALCMHKLYDFFQAEARVSLKLNGKRVTELTYRTFAVHVSNFEVTPLYPCKRVCDQQGLNRIDSGFKN
jgi:hypothetical protein